MEGSFRWDARHAKFALECFIGVAQQIISHPALSELPPFEYQQGAYLLCFVAKDTAPQGKLLLWKGHSLSLHNAGRWRFFRSRESVGKEGSAAEERCM